MSNNVLWKPKPMCEPVLLISAAQSWALWWNHYKIWTCQWRTCYRFPIVKLTKDSYKIENYNWVNNLSSLLLFIKEQNLHIKGLNFNLQSCTSREHLNELEHIVKSPGRNHAGAKANHGTQRAPDKTIQPPSDTERKEIYFLKKD